MKSYTLTDALQPPQTLARVLVVDDDAEFLRVLLRRIGRLEYQVDGASDPAEAQRLAREHEYDIALIDLKMQVNGIEVMERIARQSPEVSFVLITGAADVRDEDTRAIGQRLTSVLLKPFGDRELEAALSAGLQAKRARSSSASHQALVRVLLLEDNSTDAYLLIETLKIMGGFAVTQVSKLSDAVRLLHDEVFDTVITDLSLPDTLGLGAVVKLREAAPDVTLVVYSGVADEKLALRAIELGAQDFLVKGAPDENVGRALRFARVRRRAEQRLVQLAHTDTLTGLSNRIAFSLALERSILEVRRSSAQVSLLFIDLDGFKAVNDECGHEAGDELLKAAASRIRSCARDFDVVARLGGDEFAVLASGLSESAIDELGKRVVDAISSPVTIRGRSVKVTASIGIASYPKDARDATQLVDVADRAMYSAKRGGRARVQRSIEP